MSSRRPARRELCADLPRVVCLHANKVQHLRAALRAPQELAALAARHKALSHPARLCVLELLAIEECCVCDVAHTLRLPISTASQHLRRLLAAGLVSTRQDGRLVFYAPTSEGLEALRPLGRREARA